MWTTHGAFEFSNRLQTIEIYSPTRDADGRFTGLLHEAIFDDPEAFVPPLRIVRNLRKLSGFEGGDPQPYSECIQTIFPIDGVARHVSHGATIQYLVPDMFGRPWVRFREPYHEQGMERPGQDDLFDFSR